MDYEEFISIVEQLADLRDDEAEQATRAVLQTLAERISKAEARDLVAQLPPELGPWLFTERGGQGFDVDEFADLQAQLPKDYSYLLPKGPDVEVWAVDELLDKVSRRAELDRDGALRATEAVLTTIAERIAPGEVDDLISLLPVPLHAALKRGKTANPGTALRTPLDKFLGRVAELEGSSPEQARAHARAVFLTLRKALGNQEFFDVTVQFPPEYAALWTRQGNGGRGER